MVERLVWNGRKYRRYPNSRHEANRRYFQRSFSGGTAWLHRDVWEHHNGPIPDGFDVHHKDGDTGNNDIANLELLTRAEHVAQHPWGAQREADQRALLERIRPLTKAWHASPEGIAKHREAGSMAYAAFKPKKKRCEQCRKWFEARKIGNVDRFCSAACKAAERRDSGADNETRLCVVCGASFTANKYKAQKTCSRSCGNVERGRALRKGL